MGVIANKLAKENMAGGGVASRAAGNPAQVTPQSIIQKLASKYSGVSNTLGNFSEGAVKGALSTIRGLGEVGTKIGDTLSRGVEAVGGPKELFRGSDIYRPTTPTGEKVKEFLKPQGTAQTVGKATEQIAEFFIPAGKINAIEKILAGKTTLATVSKLTPIVGEKSAKILSKAASLGVKMNIRAAEGGGVIALQTGGDPAQTKSAAKVGAAFPALAGGLGFIGRKITSGSIEKRLAGALSGRGKAVIDEIVKDPRAAIEGLTGESIKNLGKDARILKEASVAMKAAAGKEYNRVLNNLQAIYQNEGKSFNKGTEINKITDLLESKFGIIKAGKIAELTGEVVDDAGKLDFESSRFLPKEATIIERALNIIKGFRDPLSPKTIEGLASKIDKLKSQSPSAVETNSVIHTITSSLRDSVAKMGEEAGYVEGADLARNFAVAMDKLDNFNNLFRTTADDLRPEAVGIEVSKIGEARKGLPVILPETEKTKIIQDLSTLFSGNKDVDKDILRKMVFGGQEVLSRQAGRTLATAQEKASTKLGDIIREAIIGPILPPERIGMIVAKTALGIQKTEKFLLALKKLTPAARATIINMISKYND